MDSSEIKQLRILAARSRMGAILGTYHAKSGHPGGSLSAADIFTYLYFKEMNVDPKNPDMQDRDRFVLSKGHCCPALYATLALKGFFEWDELTKLRHVGAMLQGHPDMKGTPGIDMSTGSLGQGISAACGMALAAKLDNKSYRTYTVLGDGEVVHQLEVLVHHADAEIVGDVRVVDAHVLAANADAALVRLVEAEEDAHQRRLAGAVFAE